MMQNHPTTTTTTTMNNSISRRLPRFEQNHGCRVGNSSSNNNNDDDNYNNLQQQQQPKQKSSKSQQNHEKKEMTNIQTAASAANHRHGNLPSNVSTSAIPSPSSSSPSSLLSIEEQTSDDQNTTTAINHNSINHKRINDNDQCFMKAAFERFKQEFRTQYPDYDLPIEQLQTLPQAKQYLQMQRERIKELTEELHRTKFAAKFLEEIIAHNDKESGSKPSHNDDGGEGFPDNNNETNDKTEQNNDAIVGGGGSSSNTNTPSKEQYVTVITLNDSAYGEIQKISPPKQQPQPPTRSSSIAETAAAVVAAGVDKQQQQQKLNEPDLSNKNGMNDSGNCLESTTPTTIPDKTKPNQKPEPIYSNTLETQKSTDKASKKRPPTPPRKPKLASKLNNNNNNNNNHNHNVENSMGLPLTKSKSYSNSRSQNPRKFNGPLQQVDAAEKSIISKSMNEVSCKPILRTFSVEPSGNTDHNAKSRHQQQDNQIDKKSLDESITSNEDNIYDTVAPDSDDDEDDDDCYEDQQPTIHSNDEEHETSSQEILSRCSSTDELSNYVNIDYFLRKNSLGRSNSNIPAKMQNCKNYKTNNANNNNNNNNCVEESDDNEATMSSIKSSDCDQFGSSDNILRSFPTAAPSHSMRSFNSISSTNSSSGSSLRIRNAKLLNKEFSETYLANRCAFTPPIREKNQQEFSFEVMNSDGSDVTKSLDNNHPSADTGYYAYADIYDSNDLNAVENNNKPASLESQDESVCLEDKSICKYDGSQLHNDEMDSPNNNNKKSSLISKPIESEHSQQMQWKIVRSIIDSETIYLDCLNTLNKYKKAFDSASKGEKALLSVDDLNTIFYRIPELFDLHNSFLNGLKKVEHGFKLRNSTMTADSKLASKLITKQSIGELFNKLAEKLWVYSDFLRNYSKAIETANRCGNSNTCFYDIIKSIKVASAHGQLSNLVDLLHEPVARLQKNDLVLHDLLKYSENEDEQILLKNASRLNQKFLKDYDLDAAKKLFMTHDKFKRRLVKESFIIECSDRRKLRHLFLFNDVIVSAKYKASSKQKFTFELRWFQMLNDIVLDSASNNLNLNCSQSSPLPNYKGSQQSHSMNQLSLNQNDKESKECQTTTNLISSLKSRAFLTRIDLFLEERRKGQSKTSDRLRKKISEMESELLLYLPQLRFSFHVKNNPHKTYVFYMSSEYERNCWIDAIKTLQQNASSDEHANVQVLQKWIESCRKSITMNSFLLRSNKDETIRYGDLHMRINRLENVDNFHKNLFIVMETDSFGHYFKRAVARYLSPEDRNKPQDFLIELEGSQILRLLLYEECRNDKKNHNNDNNENDQDKSLVLKGKAQLELSSSCASAEPRHMEIQLGDHLQYKLGFETRYIPWNSIMEMIPPNKIYGAFGVSIGHVCKKEKSPVPYLILSCINEVERRGLKEVGIYRVSGLSSEVQKLKKAFETNPREACYLIREIDIHSVTGLLKLYLRELPESLFTNDLLKKFFEARDLKNPEEKESKMITLLSQLIEPNQTTVIKMIEHLVLVNRFEEDNKMSLNNLATVFGPTMLRTPSTGGNSGDRNKNSISSASGTNMNQITNFGNNQMSANFASLMINTDLFTAGTIDVMAQADILHFFLQRKYKGHSLVAVEHQEETSL